MSQGNLSFPARTGFASTSKLPDRTNFGTSATQQSFAQSTFGRRPEQGYQYSGAPLPPAHGLAPPGIRTGPEKEPNAISELSDEQREELNEAFQLFDLDRDKQLNFHELRVALRALGFDVSKGELAKILHAHGTPRPNAVRMSAIRGPREPAPIHVSSLQISQAAFIQIAAQKVVERDPAVEVERAFNMFDQDRKGYIVLEDMRRASRELGEGGLEEDELQAMVDEFDYDGSGMVVKEAFYAICLH